MTRAARYTLGLGLLLALSVALAAYGVIWSFANSASVNMVAYALCYFSAMAAAWLLRPTARMLAMWREQR